MSDTIVLAIVSIIVATIGAAATIISSYISRGNRKDSIGEKLYIPDRYKAAGNARRKLSWRKTIVALCILIIGLASAAIIVVHKSGNIVFTSVFRPHILNSNLRWDAGSSEMSFYTLDGNTISLTAGPHTWPNFPMVDFKHPINGDFNVQVKVIFTPEEKAIKTAQMVGILVRPINARLAQNDAGFPEDWIIASKYVTDAGVLVGCRGSWADYTSDTVFLKIERNGDSWKCAYSHNGENWTSLSANVNNQPLQNQPLMVSLFAYSDTDKAITVNFSDWEIYENGK
jgi:hypothetical protein